MEFDSQLHIIRSCIRALPDARTRNDLGMARFKLFAALESEDKRGAKRWADALKAGLLSASTSASSGGTSRGAAPDELLKLATAALDEILQGL